MLRHLIKKEFLDSLLNQRFIALAIFSIVLMPLSAFINYKYYQARKTSFDSQYAEYNESENRRFDNRAYRPPELLSVLARGTEPYMPMYFAFTDITSGFGSDGITPGNVEAQDFSVLSTFGSFDFLFLIQVVFSLLAVLLAFDMIAGEKERGTLKAVLSNRVPRDSVILGKFMGGYSVLWLAFAIGFLLLYLVLGAFDSRFFSPETIGRVVLIFLLSSVFLACFFSLGLMVSTFCHTTSTAVVALLVLWVFLQLVVPKAGELIAGVVSPVRSEHEVRTESIKIIEEERDLMMEQAGTEYTRASGRSTLEGAFELLRSDEPWVASFRTHYQELYRDSRQKMQDRMRDVREAWNREKEQQKRLGRTISLLSPASALALIITDAAGTGDLAYSQYREAVANHYQIVDREVFVKNNTNRFQIRMGGSSIMGGFANDSDDNEDSLPPFTVTAPTLSSVLANNIWGLGTLAFYLVVSFLLSYLRFLRYDVR